MNERIASVKVGEVEIELGVPIPGRIVPPEQWAQTALKRLPVEGQLDFAELFGRAAPIVVDIGCGNGRFVISSAVRRPEFDHLGIDVLPVVIRYATRRGKERGLSNTRFAVCGGFELLERFVPTGSLAEIHIYHPQPYADAPDGHLRLLTPQFVSLVHRSLSSNGRLYIQTDNPAYWKYLRSTISELMDWHDQEGSWPEDPLGRSRREIIATKKGLPIFRGWSERRDDLTQVEAEQIADQLPLPIFSARQNRNPKRWTRRG